MGLPNENGTGMYMPIMPAYGNGNNDGFGNDGWWPLLFLFALWGNNGNGLFGNGGGSNGSVFPYFTAQNTDAQVRAGFDTAAITGHLSAIQAGQSSAEVAACNRAMNQMERSFESQTAITQALNDMSTQLAQYNGTEQLAACQTQNTIQREGSETRYANAGNTRDIIDTINNKVQTVMDKLCQLELDGVKAQVEAKNDTIAQLRDEAMYARSEASRLANANSIVNDIYNRLDTCPVGTTPVYGRTPIFTCNNNNCGCGSF